MSAMRMAYLLLLQDAPTMARFRDRWLDLYQQPRRK
jgi:hypothetical protein